MNDLDRIDLALLNEPQRDPRQTVQQLAEACPVEWGAARAEIGGAPAYR